MRGIIKIVIFCILVFLIFVVYKLNSFMYITAKFSHLRPIHSALNIYYKGIVVGKAKELKHSIDYNHTLMKLVLFPKNLHLPSNTTVFLKKEKRNNKERDFLELEYPQNPSNILLSNNSTIEGFITVDTESFLSNQKPNELEEIKENLAQSARNLNYALSSLGQIFEILDEILKENQKNIYKTTKSVENMTIKIDRALKQNILENTLSNIENTTQGISKTTIQLNQTMPNLDKTIENIEQTTCNVNEITCGIRKTLSKKFGGLRLIFGQTIQ